MEKYYRALGVYGICVKDNRLLVIQKKQGPYQNRFDLPGDRLDEGECLLKGMKRAFFEETGFAIAVVKQIGISDYIVPWRWRSITHLHHIAIFYEVELVRGGFIDPYESSEEDTTGIYWLSRADMNKDNVTPLVLSAFEWISTNKLSLKVKRFTNWEIKM